MGRSYDEWAKTQDQALLAKVRAGDEANKPLLNQINWIWVANLMAQKADLNPTSAELLDWVTSGQIESNEKNNTCESRFLFYFAFLVSLSYAIFFSITVL